MLILTIAFFTPNFLTISCVLLPNSCFKQQSLGMSDNNIDIIKSFSFIVNKSFITVDLYFLAVLCYNRAYGKRKCYQ